MKNNIVDEFLESTPHLREVLVKDFKQCPICGMNVDNMEKLAKAVAILKEKAWKYDDLCK